MIKPLVEAVRQQADRLSDGNPNWPNEPLAYAWLCCLEAAARVGRVIDAQRGPQRSNRFDRDAAAAEELREALSATRGAAAAVRFLLLGLNDEPTQQQQIGARIHLLPDRPDLPDADAA